MLPSRNETILAVTHFFKGGKTPKPPPPPLPPAPTQAADNVRKAETERRMRMRRGYASTILTMGSGTAQEPQSVLKTLLGG